MHLRKQRAQLTSHEIGGWSAACSKSFNNVSSTNFSLGRVDSNMAEENWEIEDLPENEEYNSSVASLAFLA